MSKRLKAKGSQPGEMEPRTKLLGEDAPTAGTRAPSSESRAYRPSADEIECGHQFDDRLAMYRAEY